MLKYVNIIENKLGGKTAEMLLFGSIGGDISGDLFAKEMESLSNLGIESCKIRINSIGGSVFQGYSILGAMDLLRDKGIKVKTECVGIAYSMAGIILISGCERSIVDYGSVMVHDPRFSFGKPENEVAMNLIEKTTNALSSIIVNNTDLEEEKTREYMKKETIFDSLDAKKYGFVDEVRTTGKEVQKTVQNHYELMVACTEIYNNKPKSNTMSKLTDFLGLNPDANEASILSAVKEIQNQVSEGQSLSDEVTSRDNKIEALKAENISLKKSAQSEKIENVLNKAEIEGKITKDTRENWMNSLEKDFEGTKALIDSLSGVPKDINKDLDNKDGAGSGTTGNLDLVAEFEKVLENPALAEKMPQAQYDSMKEAWEKTREVKSKVIE